MRGRHLKIAVILCAGAALAGASLPASAATRAPSDTHTSGARPVVVDCSFKAQVRPGTYLLACADGNNGLVKLHWKSWGASSATATGTDVVNDCTPYCAAGKFHSYAVDVKLANPRAWAGHHGQQRFTTLELTYPGARPDHSPRHVSYPLWS
ncbi:hypothetical protein ABZ832_26670 [Streptantibioticus parmotrematis]|uniref:hypothetical protein n=1 Tax=Streptantibioticus parmotrematis TaxID=2873249 RepID=UPI00340471C5